MSMLRILFIFCCLSAFTLTELQGQLREEIPEYPDSLFLGPQFGFKLSWGLEVPPPAVYDFLEYRPLLAGNRWGVVGYSNLALPNSRGQFSPSVGLNYVQFKKNATAYGNDCLQDSFPTFLSYRDSLPGRDVRLFNITIEPAFKIFVEKLTVFLRISPVFNFNYRAYLENYGHTCGNDVPRTFILWPAGENRKLTRLQVGGSIGLVKEIRLNVRSFLALEVGVQGLLNPVLESNFPDREGPSFDLNSAGFYLNLGFFRKTP